jgi:chromosome segregation ATPase
MADAEGVWFEPAVGEDRAAAPAGFSTPLDDELAILEARVTEAAELVLRLREELSSLSREREALLVECAQRRRECEATRQDQEALRREREDMAVRLTRIIAKVDALRGEP